MIALPIFDVHPVYTKFRKRPDADSLNLITVAEATLTKCVGMKDSELEDLIKPEIYREAFKENFGIDINSTHFKVIGKWSERLKNLFNKNGVMFRSIDEKKAKYLLAEAVVQSPHTALIDAKRTALDALIAKLELMIA